MFMRACCKSFEYLLVTAMDAVKDSNGQPGIFQLDILKRAIMLHIHK